MPRTETLALIAVGALCIIGIILLGALNDSVPSVLSDLAFVALGGGAGVARSTPVPVAA